LVVIFKTLYQVATCGSSIAYENFHLKFFKYDLEMRMVHVSQNSKGNKIAVVGAF